MQRGVSFMFFTVQQIQERLAIKKIDAVYQLIRSGALRAVNVAVGPIKPRWRISQEALDSFLRSREAVPPLPVVRRRKAKQSEVIQFFK